MRLNLVPTTLALLAVSTPALAADRGEVRAALERARIQITYEMAKASDDLQSAMEADPKTPAAIEQNPKDVLEARARLESKKDAQIIINTLLVNLLARGDALTYPPEMPTMVMLRDGKLRPRKLPASFKAAADEYAASAETSKQEGDLGTQYSREEKGRVFAIADGTTPSAGHPHVRRNPLEARLQWARQVITREEARASSDVTEATKTLMVNRGVADIEKEAEARATFQAKLKLNQSIDSLLMNLYARRNTWSFGKGEERLDENLATLKDDVLADSTKTFAEQAAHLKKRVNDVDASQRTAALRKLREYEPTWVAGKNETDVEKQKAIDATMQGFVNEYYKADLAYKREIEEARLYDSVSGYTPSGGHLVGTTLASAPVKQAR
jgi:hypothetical protein